MMTFWMMMGVLALAGSDTTAPSGHARMEAQDEPLRVVTTLPVYADLARWIGGDEVDVRSIASPKEDAHFVRPKPSFALAIRRADVFITTGMDLELWVPTLLDRAGNAQVAEGGTGYVTAYTGIKLLDIPVAADRSSGDVHLFGNPHLTTDPLRALQVARNISLGLSRVAPERAELFASGLASFENEIYRRLFGERLVDLLGGETLEELAKGGGLHEFLESQEFEGIPLLEELGGWLGAAEAFRGRRLICYHKNWAYLEERFGVICADYVEAKPGIPPTPRHVAELIRKMNAEGLNVVLAASYFDPDKVETVARRGGAEALVVGLDPGGEIADYFALVDSWVEGLQGAFGSAGG